MVEAGNKRRLIGDWFASLRGKSVDMLLKILKSLIYFLRSELYGERVILEVSSEFQKANVKIESNFYNLNHIVEGDKFRYYLKLNDWFTRMFCGFAYIWSVMFLGFSLCYGASAEYIIISIFVFILSRFYIHSIFPKLISIDIDGHEHESESNSVESVA